MMHENCQHLWRCYLLFALWTCSETAVGRHQLACPPVSASSPHPILGFWEVVRRGTGCTSRELSFTGQEVHIISLRRGVPANAQIILVLTSNHLGRAPIFVLHSQEPVCWMLSSPPGKNWTFQVSLGSSVSAHEPVVSAEADFPDSARGLLKWARRKHGGVTSLAEYHGVNTVYTCLGAEETAPATCKLHRNFLTSLHFASERQLQPLRICWNPDPPQDLEVHIIFAKRVASRPRLAHWTVELHAVGRSPRQGLLLILKSEGAAQWMVRAHRLTGHLHVLASHKVIVTSTEMKLPLTVTQQTSPELAYVRDPLQYAAEQKLPTFSSYTEAERVNRLLLAVGLSEAIPGPPENRELFGPMFLSPSRLAIERQHFQERRQKFLEEDSSSLYPLPAAETKEFESAMCLGGQKPLYEKQDTQKASCVSSTSIQTTPSEAMRFQDLPFHHGNALLSLEVYSSEAFVKQPGPCTVSANSRVFVEASLASYNFCLGFTIQQCFVSPSSDPSVASPYLLVQHGCAVDGHVNLLEREEAAQGQALPPGYQERQRLSFVLQPHSNDSIQFLHCRLTLCSREPYDNKPRGPVPKCQSENKACRGEEEQLASGRFQRTITKPIIVTMETPFRAALPGLRPDNLLANQQGKAMKDAINLRKAPQVPTAAPSGLGLLAVVGIAFSAFIIGISLTGGLWFIHSQTGRTTIQKKSQLITEKAPEETTVSTSLGISSTLTVAGPVQGPLP